MNENNFYQTNRKSIFRISCIIILLFVALNFHFVTKTMQVFPKDHLTFSNTIVTKQDVYDLLERYNKAGFWEKNAIKQEPLFRKLAEKGIIYEKDRK